MFATALVCISLSACEPAKVEIISGDTLVISTKTYRIDGFTAPAKDGRCGAERAMYSLSKKKLRDIITGSELRISPVYQDNGGARSAAMFADGKNIARLMAASGLLAPRGKAWCD